MLNRNDLDLSHLFGEHDLLVEAKGHTIGCVQAMDFAYWGQFQNFAFTFCVAKTCKTLHMGLAALPELNMQGVGHMLCDYMQKRRRTAENRSSRCSASGRGAAPGFLQVLLGTWDTKTELLSLLWLVFHEDCTSNPHKSIFQKRYQWFGSTPVCRLIMTNPISNPFYFQPSDPVPRWNSLTGTLEPHLDLSWSVAG